MKSEKSLYLFCILVALFSVNLILTNLVTSKIIVHPFFKNTPVSVADFTYPLTFVLTNIITEVWGVRRARFAVNVSLIMHVFMLIIAGLALNLTPPDYWLLSGSIWDASGIQQVQGALESIWKPAMIAVVASMLAYFLGHTFTIKIFDYIRRKTNGKYCFLRSIVSTSLGEFVDTVIFGTIYFSFGLRLSWNSCFSIIAIGYLTKLLFIFFFSAPLFHIGALWIKKKFINDSQDTPFAFENID